MTATKIKMSELKDGMILWNHGHQFIARDVRMVDKNHTNGAEVVRYKGVCTPHRCNDSIRHTIYNGGTYGGIGSLDICLVDDADTE